MAENVKIVFTVTNDLSHDQRMIRICSSLSHAGYDCLLVGRELDTSKTLLSQPFSQKRLKCIFNKGKLFYLEYNLRLFAFLLLLPCKVIYSVDCDTALPGRWVSLLRHKKWIFDAHELFTEVPEVVRRKAVKKVWAWVQKIAFSRADLCLTVGNELAKWFEKKYGRKVVTVKNAPLQNLALPYSPDPDRFILYQGALNEGRGLENLIMAMQQIPCRLVLAGEGDLTQKLKALTQQLNLLSKVEFKGMVSPENLPALTARAYMGYNVSENAGLSYYYSLNNKFFDYVHAGLPSLINPFPEYMALNQRFEVGIITAPSVEEIVKHALILLEDDILHRKLHGNCTEAKEIWNWEEEQQVLLKAVAEVTVE